MAEHTPTIGMTRKLAAIFSTDVASYSRLMGDDEEATIRTLTTYRAVIFSLIQHHRGCVVDSPGDNLLAEFASVVGAVRCAVEIQHALKEKNTELLDHRRMHFRIGINLGEVIVEGERLYGEVDLRRTRRFIDLTKRAVHIDEHLALARGQIRVAHHRLNHIAFLHIFRIENTGLGIQGLCRHPQAFGDRLQNHATRHAQPSFDLAEIGIGNATHVCELSNRELC